MWPSVMVQKECQEKKNFTLLSLCGAYEFVLKSISLLYDIVEGRIPKLSTVLGNTNDD